MKTLFAILLFSGQTFAGVPLWQNVPSTGTGTSTTYLSGTMKVYPATTTAAASPSIWLNGPSAQLTVRSGANVATMSATGFYGSLYGTASTATVLSGGAAGSLPWQTGVGNTAFLAAGTAGYLLQGNATAAPTWTNTPTLTGTNIAGLNATNLIAGVVPVARVSGAYTSVTGLGTLTAGSIPSTLISGTIPANQVNLSTVTTNHVLKSGDTMTGQLTNISSITVSGALGAAYYQINGSTVLAIVPGSGILIVGENAGLVNTGSNNSFSGYLTGTLNTTGTANTFSGSQAGATNSEGSNNSFYGFQAGKYNLASYGSFFGRNSGIQNTIGEEGCFFGVDSGANNTIGMFNNYFGSGAGGDGTIGSENSVFGHQALRHNVNGSANAIFGTNAGHGVSGNSFSSSTIVGYQAGYGNTTGGNNIFLGWQAGYAVTTGSGNIIIGYNQQGLVNSTNTLSIGNGLITGDMTVGVSSLTFPGKLYLGNNLYLTNNDIFYVDNITVTSVTVTGNTFSVGGSTFVISQGSIAIGNAAYAENHLHIKGAGDISNIGGRGNGLTLAGTGIALSKSVPNERQEISFSAWNDGRNADLFAKPQSVIGQIVTSTLAYQSADLYIANRNGTGDTYPVELIRFHNGNIGIGDASPLYKLSVSSGLINNPGTGAGISTAGMFYSSGTGNNNFTGSITASSITATAALGLSSPRLNFRTTNVELSSTTAANYGGVYASSHVFVNGNLYATALFGNGASLTGLPGGGDAVLAGTQTYSGSPTYTGVVTFSSGVYGVSRSSASIMYTTATATFQCITGSSITITTNGNSRLIMQTGGSWSTNGDCYGGFYINGTSYETSHIHMVDESSFALLYMTATLNAGTYSICASMRSPSNTCTYTAQPYSQIIAQELR